MMYDGGGFNTRFQVGLFDIFDLGVSENFDGLIGSGDINVNIPGAAMKLTVLKDFYNFNWAVGFDSFAYGRNGTYYSTNNSTNSASTIYGFYTVGGFRYSMFGGNDFFSFGLRFPLLPEGFRDIRNTSLFMAFTLSAQRYFSAGIGLENMYLSFDRGDRILPTLSLNLNPIPDFRCSLILQAAGIGATNRCGPPSVARKHTSATYRPRRNIYWHRAR